MNRKQTTLLIVLALILGAAGWLGSRLLVPEVSIRDVLAQTFDVPPNRLYINLPPATGRYPGGILLETAQGLLPVSFAPEFDERLQRGTRTALDFEISQYGFANTGLSAGVFDQLVESGRVSKVSISVIDVVPIEMSVGDLKDILLESEDAVSASNNNTPIYIVSRAYEGRLVVGLSTNDSSAASAVAKDVGSSMPGVQVEFGSRQESAGDVMISFADATVFAYELMEASFFSTSLSIEPTDVVLTPVASDELTTTTQASANFDDHESNWGLVTLASGIYPQQPVWDQYWNALSAEAVASELLPLGPEFNRPLHASEHEPLTKKGVEEFISAMQRDTENVEFLVVYYVGHMLRRSDGEFVLLTAEHDAHSVLDPSVEALTVRSLYDSLARLGKPFALLIDGCMEDDEVDAFRTSLGFVLPANHGMMNYIGPAEFITDELSQYMRALDRAVSDHEYLHGENPVILGAKPGTVAPGLRDPISAWGSLKGPLAERILRLARPTANSGSSRPVGNLLRRLVDFNGVGELTSAGTISWSNFSAFDIAGINRTESGGTNVAVLNDTPFEGIDRLMPLIDQKGFWVHDFNGDIWLWDIAENKRDLVVQEHPFTEIVSVPDSDSFASYDGWAHSVSLHHADGTESVVLEGMSIGVIKGHPNASLLVMEDNGDVSAPDRLFRIINGEGVILSELEGSSIFDVVDGPNDSVYASMPDRGMIIKLTEGEEVIFAAGLPEPTQMSSNGSHIYVISADGLQITRINEQGARQTIHVSDYVHITDIPAHPRRTFSVLEEGSIIVANEGLVYRIDSDLLEWQELGD